jgi:hypothetical protein
VEIPRTYIPTWTINGNAICKLNIATDINELSKVKLTFKARGGRRSKKVEEEGEKNFVQFYTLENHCQLYASATFSNCVNCGNFFGH